MKKLFTIMLMTFVLGTLFAEAPDYSFHLSPISLGETWYDYMPGSYANTNVQSQSDSDGGTYIFWHRTPSADASAGRRVYYTYIDGNGNATPPCVVDNRVTSVNFWEGYPSVDVDVDTGIPFFSYHVNNDSDSDYEVNSGWDNYQYGTSGIISLIGEAYDNTQIASEGIEEHADFIWPYTFVTPHPTNPNLKRIIVIASNASDGYSDLTQADNILISRADIDISNIAPNSSADDLEWTYSTIPHLDNLAMNGHRAFIKVPVVSETGEICIFGKIYYSENSPELQGINTEDLFIAYSNDGGDSFSFETTKFENNVLDQSFIPESLNPNGTRTDFHWGLYSTNHMNAVWGEDDKIILTANLSLQFYENEATAMLLKYLQYPKSIIVDPQANTVMIKDIWPQREEGLFLPWDVDEDGEYDINEDGITNLEMFWPHAQHDEDRLASENFYRITKGFIGTQQVYAAVWTNGTNNKKANMENPDPEFSSWNEVPEIAISISNDGINWLDPVLISSHEDTENTSGVTELHRANGESMLPVFVTPADRIKDLGYGWGRIGISFLDDYYYGSGVVTQPSYNTNGKLHYMEIDVDFSGFDNPQNDLLYGDIDENEAIQAYDASLVLQYTVGLDPIPEIDPRPWTVFRETRADVDGNNVVQAYDASLIMKKVLGIIDTFPIERGIRTEQIDNYQPALAISYENEKLNIIAEREISSFEIKINDENINFNEFEFNSYFYAKSDNHFATFTTDTFPLNEILALLPIQSDLNELNLTIVEDNNEYVKTIILNPTSNQDVSEFENKVFGNYPNPFNPMTTIRFSTKNDNAKISLEIYNVKGQKIKTYLKTGLNSGNHSITWNGTNKSNQSVSSGIYFYRMKIDSNVMNGKMLMIK